MKKAVDWTGFGFLLMIFGIISILTGKAGWTIYGHAEGEKARYIGVIMIIFGIALMIPKLRSMINQRK